jgi:hypothetical protein
MGVGQSVFGMLAWALDELLAAQTFLDAHSVVEV